MDNCTNIATIPLKKTKDDFIHQAHEARQARELARRKDKAATTIQATLRAYHTRRMLKKDACNQLNNLLEEPNLALQRCDLLIILRKVIFACHPKQDRSTLNSMLQFVLENSYSGELQVSNESTLAVRGGSKGAEIIISKRANNESDDLTGETSPINTSDSKALDLSDPSGKQSSLHDRNLVARLVSDSIDDKKNYQLWYSSLQRILNLCLNFLADTASTRLDSQCISTYLRLINIFTSHKLLCKMIETTQDGFQDPAVVAESTDILKQISGQLFVKISETKTNFFKNLTTIICENINKFRNDLRSITLNDYTQLALKLIMSNNQQQTRNLTLQSELDKESVDILIGMLSIPGFLCSLKKYCPQAMHEFEEESVYKLVIRLLVASSDLQGLTSTKSVCLLANTVHLASLNTETLSLDIMSFVLLVTKLLESCQKNMLQSSSSANLPSNIRGTTCNPNSKKKNESMEVSFNSILGWLVREQASTIDRDVIKSQLNHLWNMKFLKILLGDLVKLKTMAQKDSSEKRSNAPSSSPKQKSMWRNSSNNPSNCDNNQVAGLLRRTVSRAAITVTRTINIPHVKSSRDSIHTTGSVRLMTDEAKRIAQVCLMLHTSLKTLTTLKQDILAGLCLHDYLLPNLWGFICSLGPMNGLKAFLEHLTSHTKTNAPEFHILTLFCECSSHLISILDDSELYEHQRPFSLENLVDISSFLNIFVYRVLSNSLIPVGSYEVDPIIRTTHKLLTDLYKRDCRRKFTPQNHWLIKELKISLFLKDLEAGKSATKKILNMLPHIIPHKERVLIFRKLVSNDRAKYCTAGNIAPTFITIHRSRIVEDGYQQLIRLPPQALKGLIRVKFINDHGLDEAGIDQDGVFKEFLEDTIKRVFDPALNLFCSTSEQRLYPSPTSRLHEDYLSLFNFVGKMVAKAIYEGIVVDVPFATFFLSRVLGQPQSPLYSPIDELPSLDPELYKSLTYIKHYEGDVSELDLTFSIDQDFMGKIETYELEPGGKSIPVTKESRVRYIHAVANFRMKTQIEKQTEAFVAGFKSIINLEWLSMFSASEFQRLISGDNTPIDLLDLRRNTKYFGGFHNNHRVVCWLWDILEKDFSSDEHKLFLKFVTSCSKPPLLGFANLEPPFSIRCVEVSDDQDLGDTIGSILRGFFAIRRSDPVDRLPTSSTCFNLLKLPNYQRRSTLREKLRYAIRSNPGFELS